MQLNPIIVRESRARWRGMGAFVLLFGYAAVLAISLFWRYSEASDSFTQGNPLDRIERLGHELFVTLVWMQSLAWALIGPAITATSIASEREAGMLEAMQLSPLTPRQIVWGKLISALSFVALLLLVSLPITATCFLMGGVSPAEFLAAFALHTTTALTGAIIGLTCSALGRRANSAMRSAYVFSIAWLLGSFICIAGVTLSTGFGKPMLWIWQVACTVIGWSNPLIATAGLIDSNAMGPAGTALSGLGVFATSPWLISIVFQLMLCAILLKSATRALRRPLGEQYWIEPKRFLEVPAALQVPAAIEVPAANATAEVAPSPRRDSNAKEWWLIPYFSTLTFLNPVLQRETRSKFRMRQPPFWVIAFEACLALFVFYFYLRTFWWALFSPSIREVIWWIIVFIGLAVVALTSAVSGSNAFTREREIKTWESLRMSLLSPREIVTAKLGAVLIGFAVFTLPFWPLLLPCIRHIWHKESSDFNDGVALTQAIVCFFLIAATGICYTLWGMFWSWRCRKTTAATGWTLGSLFFALVFAPSFMAVTVDNKWGEFIWSYHPFVSMAILVDGKQMAVSVMTVLFLLAASWVIWLKLCADIKNE